MAKIACYTPEGKKVMKEPVDVRECVEHLNFTTEFKEVKEKVKEKKEADEKKKEPDVVDISKLNKKALVELAKSKGIELDSQESKPDLIAKIKVADADNGNNEE
jgi:hypothetical protein